MHRISEVLPVRSCVHCPSAARGNAPLNASSLAGWVLRWWRMIDSILVKMSLVCLISSRSMGLLNWTSSIHAIDKVAYIWLSSHRSSVVMTWHLNWSLLISWLIINANIRMKLIWMLWYRWRSNARMTAACMIVCSLIVGLILIWYISFFSRLRTDSPKSSKSGTSLFVMIVIMIICI